MPAMLSFVKASLTSSSLFGRMIALISFIRSPLKSVSRIYRGWAVLHEENVTASDRLVYSPRRIVERRVSMRRVLFLLVFGAVLGPIAFQIQSQNRGQQPGEQR